MENPPFVVVDHFPIKKKTSSIFDSPQKGNIFAGDGYFPLAKKRELPSGKTLPDKGWKITGWWS